jgi:hypothetical protein
MTNREDVRRYYAKHRETILARRALYRCRMYGAVPRSLHGALAHVSQHALVEAWAHWAGTVGTEDDIRRSYAKLAPLLAD